MNKAKIKVVDSIMGQGKTTWAINYMRDNPKERFMYITPFLDEVERVQTSVPNSVTPFVDGKSKKSKLQTLRELTKQGRDIITTHALLGRFDLEIQENIKIGEYTLILDEVASIAEEYSQLTSTDKENFFKYFADVDEDGFVVWRSEEHPPEKYALGSKFYEEMVLCLNRHLLVIDDKLMMWELPVNIFKQFKEVYILTYMFDGSIQRPYFDLYNVEYNYLSIKQGKLIPYEPTPKEVKQEIKQLINLVDIEKMNEIGEPYYALSSTWLRKNISEDSIYSDVLKKNCNNFFKNKCKGNAQTNMVTTLSESFKYIKDKGWSSIKTSFVTYNKRATNDYVNKINLAYLLNVFPHTSLTMYFNKRSNGEINIDEDEYALSILIQWIWRSRIRNQSLPKEQRQINLYLPSSRMRKILLDWLDS